MIKRVAPARDAAVAGKADAARGRPKWLVCGSAKGGVGKTTCALNLATLATQDGLRVALLDTETQETLTHWHQRRPAEAPPIRLFTVPLRDITRAISEISACDDIDLVIVDTPPGIDERPVEIKRLLQKADFVLVPCTSGTADIRSVTEFMAVLRRDEIPSSFVLNRVLRSYNSYHEAKRDLNKAGPLCPVDIRQLEDIQSTHKRGVGINEIQRAKGVEDFDAVWVFVRQALGMAR